MSAPEADNFYMYLSKNPIRFEPVSSVTSVFFDDSNRQVFTVRSNGAAGVVVKGPDDKFCSTLRLDDRGEIISVKYSYDMKILGVQRSTRAVDFINLFPGADINEYSQTCKGKETKIIGFCWTSLQEIVYVTDHGLEHYQVIPEKKTLKLLKTYSLNVNWFIWLVESAMLLVSSGTLGNTLYPFYFKSGSVVKLPKFEVELLTVPKPPCLTLKQRDVTLATIYGQLYVLVLRHGSTGPRGTSAAEVLLYQILNESTAKKTDILRLNLSGRFALNVVDNLVVVHHQVSKTSLLYDIRLPGESGLGVTCHQPFLSPLPIRPFKLILPAVPTSSGAEVQEYNCELYSPNWVIFQPDIVLDAKLGCFWYLRLNLESVVSMITDKCRLIDFLLLRQDSKMVILNVCRSVLVPGRQVNLTIVATIFNKLNRVYNDYLNTVNGHGALPPNSGSESNRLENTSKMPIIDQSDVYTHVFSVFDEYKDSNYKFVVAVIIEYLRSLGLFQIPIQHFLFELIINTLVHQNCYYQLHQFLQYHVVSDSKPLACLLLSLESSYPPAYQLALDMLKRLATANDSIIEVLISKQQLLPAIRFAQSVGLVDQVSARKFLEAAKATENPMTFFTVFRFFEQRNVRLRGNAKFHSGEHCDPYVDHFKQLFGAEALLSTVALDHK